MANILDLDPFAFAAALEELQLPEEDAARIREQYRQKQTPFAGAKEAVKPQEGRNTSAFLPVSVPEGMSITEGVTSGNWDWAVPEGLSSGATALIEGVEAPGQIASGVPFSEQELQDAAWKTAAIGGGVKELLDADSKGVAAREAEYNALNTENATWETFDDSDILDGTDFYERPQDFPKVGDMQGALEYVSKSLIDSINQGYTSGGDSDKVAFLSNKRHQEWLKNIAEELPHYNDPAYFDYFDAISNYAKQEGFASSAVHDLVMEMKNFATPKKDPERAYFAEKELPYAAPVGQRAAEQIAEGRTFPPRPSDAAAEALGFKDTVYHTTTARDEFTQFDPDRGFGFDTNKAAQDYLGVHVGTPRAAGERNTATKRFKSEPHGFTMELRARTDQPATKQEIAKVIGITPKHFFKNLDAPFSEEELNYALILHADKIFGANQPEDALDLAAIDLRKQLANRGYTHIPYINDIEDTGSTSFIMLVDRPKNSPAVLRDVRAKFDPKKINDPDLRFATGGMVQGTNMEQNMTKLFAEGGINTAEVEVDPVSGNEIPPGSLPEEVRDDVDAKLSGGEYVVPADVLRYYGVSFFEKLRKKAKEGLAEMDAEGRIGGDTAPAEGMTEGPEMDEEDEDLPFEEDELMYEEDDMEFAQGGAVPGQNAFNPNQFYSGFSAFGDVPQAETRTYVSASGQRMSIQFVNGQPQQPIPAGFYPEGQLPTNPTAAPSQPQETGRRDAERNQSQTRQNTNEGFDWAKGKDFKNMSATEAAALANSRLEGNNMAQGIAQGVGALLGPAGALMSGAMKMRPVAEVNGIERHLRSIGNTEAADAVAAIGDKYISERGIGLRALENVIAPGTQVAKTLAAMQGQAVPQATAKTGSSAAGRTIIKDGDRSGGAGPTKGPISRPAGGSSQKKGSTAPAPRPAPAKETPRASAPSKPGKASTTARAEGGLIERRKK